MKRLFLTIMLLPLTAMATNNGGNHGQQTSGVNASQVTSVDDLIEVNADLEQRLDNENYEGLY